MPSDSPRSILITGASSGIGAALALVYAAPGVHLSLGGRARVRLDAVAEDCRRRGATVETGIADVTDAAATRAWIEAADDANPLDLVIANAGVSGGIGGLASGEMDGVVEPAAQVRRILAVNIDGVVNSVMPAAPGHGPGSGLVCVRPGARRFPPGDIARFSRPPQYRGRRGSRCGGCAGYRRGGRDAEPSGGRPACHPSLNGFSDTVPSVSRICSRHPCRPPPARPG